MGFITHDPIVTIANTVSEAMVQPEVADQPPMADCPHNLPVIKPAFATE